MPNTGRPRILVAEDDADQVALMNVVLKFDGYAVISASDGAQALAQAERSHPVLIILDIGLGSAIDGLKVLERLKANAQTAAIPVMMLTGDDSQEKRDKAMVLGADCYMTKPYDVHDLIKNVQDCLATHRRQM